MEPICQETVGTQDDHTIISVVIPTLEHVNNKKDKLLLGGEGNKSSVVTLDQGV